MRGIQCDARDAMRGIRCDRSHMHRRHALYVHHSLLPSLISSARPCVDIDRRYVASTCARCAAR